jgi:8-oxo-dGTP pyrophosphatase MutT (NUDIX family)
MSESQWNSWITELRARLGQPEGRRLPPSDARQAALLVPLYVDAGELWTFLARRSEELPHHRGQIAFPGGSLESGEGHWDAALREAYEEVGLDPKRVLRLGTLDEAETPSGFRIVPCVGAVPYPVETKPDGEEVEEVFAVPISAFANPKMIEDRQVTVDGRERWIRVYHVGSRHVWGLTAHVIQNLLERLGLAPQVEPTN